MDTRLCRLQFSLDDKKRRADQEEKEIKQFFYGNSLKAQLQHKPDDSEKVEDLRYQLHGAVAKERRAQKTVESFQSPFYTVRATVDSQLQRLPNFAERVKTEEADGFGGFLSAFLQKAQNLIKNQRDTIDLTVKTGREAVHAFLRSLESTLSHPRPCSQHR